MFTANTYVDVYREMGDPNYSEYDESVSQSLLVDTKVPIHITPFAPKTSPNGMQSTKIIANTRRNHILRVGDELRAPNGRRFVVDTVEPTDGAFMGNSVVYQLTEHNAVA